MNSELRLQYEAVVKDLVTAREELRTQIAELQSRMKEYHQDIESLNRRMGQSLSPTTTPIDASQRYAHLSVRWAVLDFLSTASEPKSTTEIAEELQRGGIETKAANFANNVSAVLSVNCKEKKEVEVVDGKWALTSGGRSAIEHIRGSSKFRRAVGVIR